MERDYELLFILDPTLSEEAVEKEMAKVMAIFPKEKVTCQNLGRKKFAYPIKKQTQGYYIVCNFSADVEKRNEVEEVIRTNPVLLRYLLIRALRQKQKKRDDKRN